jgi:hypothetical protein
MIAKQIHKPQDSRHQRSVQRLEIKVRQPLKTLMRPMMASVVELLEKREDDKKEAEKH